MLAQIRVFQGTNASVGSHVAKAVSTVNAQQVVQSLVLLVQRNAPGSVGIRLVQFLAVR